MSNPYQEPIAEEFTVGEALRLIAERTPFRTEEESTRVLATIDKLIEDERHGPDVKDQADEPEPDLESEPSPDPAAVPGPSVAGGVQDGAARTTRARK